MYLPRFPELHRFRSSLWWPARWFALRVCFWYRADRAWEQRYLRYGVATSRCFPDLGTPCAAPSMIWQTNLRVLWWGYASGSAGVTWPLQAFRVVL